MLVRPWRARTLPYMLHFFTSLRLALVHTHKDRGPLLGRNRFMRIQKPGFINQNLLYLGSRSICMYLVMGESYALLGGGVPWVVKKLETQLDDFNIDRTRIRYVMISHAHHDHCGAIPYLLARYPHIKTISSQYGAYILNHAKPVSLIKQVNRTTLDALKHPHSINDVPLDFHAIPIDMEVGDGDRLDLDNGLSLQFFLTPGHSRCSLSVYVPELKALFPADAVPFPEEGKRELTVTANHDYDDYIQSLEKLQGLDIEMVCYEHGGVLTGEDAADIIPRSLEATLQQRERIQKRYEELKDFDRLVEETAEKYQALELFRLVPADAMRAITKQMVRSALGLTDKPKKNPA